MVADRRLTTYHDDGTKTVEMQSWSWGAVRGLRRYWLERTDLWYLKDRWDGLSSSAKGQLNTFRETLRDLPQVHADPDAATDAFPAPEEWF